jgi:DNA polymerase III delta prime subunit
MGHLVARNRAGRGTVNDTAECLTVLQRTALLLGHAALADKLADGILLRRTPPAELAASLRGCVARLFAEAAELLLVAPASMPDEATRQAAARGLEDERNGLAQFGSTLARMAALVLNAIAVPETQGWATLSIEVPAVTLLRDVAGTLTKLLEAGLTLSVDESDPDAALTPGFGLALALRKKLLRASNLTERQAREAVHRLKWPSGKDGKTLVTQYFGGTALEALLLTPVTLAVTDAHLLEHMLLIGAPGHGKTQTLEHMIARHLERPHADRCGLVVIDSHGDLLKRVMRHRACAERLIYVDPTDIDCAPALNMFDLGAGGQTNDARAREQNLNATLALYEYIVGGLLGAELSAKMCVPMKFLIALMLEVPDASLQDLRAALGNLDPYRDAIARLPQTAQRFFAEEFEERTFSDTRKQIGWRIDGLLVNRSFERIFATRKSKLDLYTALNDGKIILINTSKEFLQKDGSAVFGRTMIAMVLKAALDRARLPEHARRTSFLIIDEASEYFDSSVNDLLKDVRKFGLGVTIANQSMKQMSVELADFVMGMTAVKLVGGLSDRGADMLASNMRTHADFIHAQTKTAGGTRFAAFVRNLTPEAVSLAVPFGTLDRAPKLSDAELAALLERNRRALTSSPEEMPSRDTPRLDRARPETPRRDVPERNDSGDRRFDSPWGSY